MENPEKQEFTKIWAPILISYTHWVLKELQSRGIKRAYFLARDARMPYLAARKLAEYEGMKIECRYLEGSRYAWRMAEFALPETDILGKICIGGLHVSLRTILQRGGLNEEEKREVIAWLKERNALFCEPEEPLSYAQTQLLKNKLKDCECLLASVRKHGAAAYESTIAYFRKEGLLEEEPFAIVDSGWTGTLQQTLKRLLVSGGRKEQHEILGFYFGLYELPSDVRAQDYHTYYFRPYRDIAKKVYFSNCLFEAVLSAPEGMTVGYEALHPVRESRENLNHEKIMVNIRTLQLLLEDKGWVAACLAQEKCGLRRLRRLMSHPSREQVRIFGSYLFSDDVFSAHAEKTAVYLHEKEIRNLHALRRLFIMKGWIHTPLKDSPWPEGSVVKYGENVGWHLLHIRIYKYLLYIRKMRKSV